eukprot:564986-Hanusia_phi.AAC.2
MAIFKVRSDGYQQTDIYVPSAAVEVLYPAQRVKKMQRYVELLARVLHVAEYEALTTHNLHGIQADISEFAQEMDAVPKLTEYLFDNNDDQLSFSLCLLLRVAPPEALRRLFSKDVVLKGMRCLD